MTILDLARVAEAALAVAVVFVAVKAPRHRPLAAWLVFSLAHSLANRLWLTPVLESLPRPYVGNGRIVLHVGQALHVLVPFAFVRVAWALVRVPRWLRPLPWAAAFVVMVVLVDGYRHAPSPGVYQIAHLTFGSDTVFRLAFIAGDAMLLFAVVPRWRDIVQECRGTDDTALLGSIVALEAAGVLRLTLSFTSAHGSASFAAAALILGYVVALGFHAPVIYLHLLGAKSERFLVRQHLALRREAIFEMEWRLEDSRAAIGRLFLGSGPTPRAFPQAFPAAVARGRSIELLTLAMKDPVVAGGVELIVAIAKGLGPRFGALLIEDARSLLLSLAPGEGRSEEEFPWIETLEHVSSDKRAFYAPLLLPLIGTLRGMSWAEALATIDFAHALAGPEGTS